MKILAKIKNNFAITVFVWVFLFIPINALAAKFYFTGPKEVKINESFTVSAMINPEDFINAVEGQIKIDANLLELESITDGSSVAPLWIEAPKYDGGSFINFSGVMPGGVGPVISKESRLFDITFRAKAAGQARINFTNYQAYLHRAQAERASGSTEDMVINILPEETVGSENALVLDFYPPESFELYVTKNKDFFDNNYVLLFSAQDKGSGVDHYEIKESFLGLSGAWRRGESPHKLLDQNLFSMIEVRAVDRVGRERIEKLIPARLVYATIMILVVFAFLVAVLIYRSVKKALKQSIRDVFRRG